MIEFHLDGRSGVSPYLQLVQQVRIVDADDGILLADKGIPRRSHERDRVA